VIHKITNAHIIPTSCKI